MYCDECSTGFWGGSAMTTSECLLCKKETLFPSTAVDKYCEECADTFKICTHCGKPLYEDC